MSPSPASVLAMGWAPHPQTRMVLGRDEAADLVGARRRRVDIFVLAVPGSSGP
jgi:hypothetical protein